MSNLGEVPPWFITFNADEAKASLSDATRLSCAFMFQLSPQNHSFWWEQVAAGELSAEGRQILQGMIAEYEAFGSGGAA